MVFRGNQTILCNKNHGIIKSCSILRILRKYFVIKRGLSYLAISSASTRLLGFALDDRTATQSSDHSPKLVSTTAQAQHPRTVTRRKLPKTQSSQAASKTASVT